MADKRTNCVKVCFTDREYIDLNRVAVKEDRTKADMAYVLVRRGLYGMMAPPVLDGEGTEKDRDGL